nr:hypothetical protein [bacterium]
MNRLELSGKNISVQVNENLSLIVLSSDGRLLWESSKTHTPIITIRANDTKPRTLPLADAKE